VNTGPSPLRQGLVGLGLGLLAVLGPLTPRFCFGTIPAGYYGAALINYSITIGVSVAVILAAFHAMQARGFGLRLSTLLGLLTAIPVMVLSYLLTLMLARAFPSLPLLDPNEPRDIAFHLATGLGDSLPVLAAWAGLVFLPTMIQTHDARANEVERLRSQAELLRLRSHLEPHFVLNTLNAIAGLVSDEPDTAREMLASFGDLFRDAAGFREAHRLSDEIAWLERYVAIHELRHPGLLRVSWEIDPATLDRSFPALLLQPIVENAIVHGALKRQLGHVTIRARAASPLLLVEVIDDGPALGSRRPLGQGLSIVERRLALEDGKSSHFSLGRRGDHTVATITLPLRPFAPGEAP
jgi:hypothetical protein